MMYVPRRFGTASHYLVVLGLLLSACSQDDDAAGSTAPAAPTSTNALPPESREALEGTLAAYEAVRAKLADDQIDAIAGDVAALELAVSSASANAPAALRAHLLKMAKAVSRLKDSKDRSSDVIRRAFGEVSRQVVALLAADPSLRGNRHVFECPMVEGYKKWVQLDDKISNPYMGSRMRECGAQSSLP